jgi:hypothetical protein
MSDEQTAVPGGPPQNGRIVGSPEPNVLDSHDVDRLDLPLEASHDGAPEVLVSE